MTDYQAEDYLETRASNEGITYDDLMSMTPASVSDDPVEAATFWQTRDYSHIMPVSTHPHLADDPTNAMPEDASTNRSRGAEPMTELEQLIASIDNEIVAADIDLSDVSPLITEPDVTYTPFVLF